ncbi:MAG: hypothetical protein JSW27_14805 [Phycisphaerales bacterium]|nr:MAG: hypothetical protein JSW27_14805 [Phycisphaerales bacterium]
MKLTHVLVVIILALAAVYFVSQRGGATEITRTGDSLSIVIGQYRLEARLEGEEFRDSFLVIGGIRQGNLYFSTLLSVIPLDTAEQLAQRYGNFRRCSSPGARAGMDSVISMALYANDGQVERTLQKVNKLALAGKDPVIAMTFAPLEIMDRKVAHGGEEIPLTTQDDTCCYLVTEAKLVQQGLDFED